MPYIDPIPRAKEGVQSYRDGNGRTLQIFGHAEESVQEDSAVPASSPAEFTSLIPGAVYEMSLSSGASNLSEFDVAVPDAAGSYGNTLRLTIFRGLVFRFKLLPFQDKIRLTGIVNTTTCSLRRLV